MISIADLREIAAARLEDANVLFTNGRNDGAAYVCGYAIELALKARICDTLNWLGFPETQREFEDFRSFKTHRLHVLLALSGQEQRIKTAHLEHWSTVATWDPEARYRGVGQVDSLQVALMIISVEELLKVL